MEWDKKDLERQLNELKLKFEQAERTAAEQRQVDEKKHAEEIQFLKRTNQQLKVGISRIVSIIGQTVSGCTCFTLSHTHTHTQGAHVLFRIPFIRQKTNFLVTLF